MTQGFELQSNPVQPVYGAYEVLPEGTTEHLTTLTRTGSLLAAQDQMPYVPGIDSSRTPYVVQTVNALGTPTCETCTGQLEQFQIDNPDIPVYTLTKQNIGELGSDPEVNQDITHSRIQIDPQTAIDLGVELEPGEGADVEFWSGALRRAVIVVGAGGEIAYIEQHDDQEQMPDFDSVFEAALKAAAQSQS